MANELDKHAKTLRIEDFMKFAKAVGMVYITAATLYDERGVECKTSIDKKKNKKWKELLAKWLVKEYGEAKK
ncbi:hypothetical protein UFOVP903_18 [uncultured Caudovirales phage]|uniref:Uncharacterized protein n=1 Tax=uncultured Caudovirales phage TaxID=2100421 RepID=A0A6J5RJC2_9CAUD|nr:hypothetical protein UFOVP903_18 [uncultured Caudovirales phage]CAB4197650.1 hypothetical protein UFOVP1318_28 [uncultured Caudovirales phage]CAB4210442.1 hypothetical protein UFOVP1430_16 [uncultured Caudovirales phage]